MTASTLTNVAHPPPGRPRLDEAGTGSSANHWLDRFAADRVTHAGSTAPPYLVFGCAGIATGSLVLVGIGTARSVPAATLATLVLVSVFAFVTLGLAQKTLLGAERHVLWENVLLVLLAGAGVGALSPVPVGVVVDCQAVGLGLVLAVARWGCLAHGCCHGRPATFGVRYESGLHVDSPLTGIRLFPLQLLDSVALAAVTGVSLAVMSTGADPGSGVVTWVLGYGAVRSLLEPLRGDTRPRVGPLTEAQWTFLGCLVAIVLIDQLRVGAAATSSTALAAAALLVAAVGYTARGRLLARGPTRPTADETHGWQHRLATVGARAGASGETATVSGPWRGAPLQVALTVDRLEPPLRLYAFVARRSDGLLDERDAVLVAALLVQSLPAHRVLRASVCAHGNVAVWAAVNPQATPGSTPGDDPAEVELRTLAAVGEVAPLLRQVDEHPLSTSASASPSTIGAESA